MSNRKRICIPNSTYHTFSRCHDRQHYLQPDKMKVLMFDVLNLALEKYNFELISFAIMDNHFHFLIRTLTDGPTISRIMQFIKAQFARRYNKIANRTGSFWNERFGDVIIELTEDPEFYFHWLNWYMGYNSVRAHKVNDPRKYAYCSILSYLDENYRPPVKITHHEYFLKLGKTFHERSKIFLEYEDIYRKRLCLNFL
ncbi:MAG: hypothetical protein CVV44_21555 [Spirochaetae bacterium HGW-Spirochaetae-1]|nr:MAG: hypothetical protein CVV44_21555 [Spirochaetae bacterium HGW-Spirochaetae-1]